MSNPLLNDLEHILRLMTVVRDAPIDPVYKPDIDKYLRWAARSAAKAYWRAVSNDEKTGIFSKNGEF